VVYVSDTNGGSNANMVSKVIIELFNWRAAGALVSVSGGALYDLTPITLSLTVRAGVDTTSIATNVKAAIVDRLARLKIGETASRQAIAQAAMNVDLENITNVNIVNPATDVVPTSPNQLIRTTVGDITIL
jgi:hypothetical protein